MRSSSAAARASRSPSFAAAARRSVAASWSSFTGFSATFSQRSGSIAAKVAGPSGSQAQR